MKFIDNIKMCFKAGSGGSGVVSFFQDWMQTKARADGGDGGDGGNVILVAAKEINSFAHLPPNKLIQAENGEVGKRSKKHGKNGKDTILLVPLGTVVLDENKKQILFNFEHNKQSYIVAKGGKGGKGNASLVSNHNKKSIHSQPGTLCEIKTIFLELKILANVGLIGLPNVGKSSLLAALTNAHPEIKNYRFTTITPNLGILNNQKNIKILLADLPGIIEGAAQNKGLGNQFLKHAERCYLLLHVVDMNVDNFKEFKEKFYLINKELLSYNEHFIKIPQIIVGNKIDLIKNQQTLSNFKKNAKKICDYDFVSVSAKEKLNLNFLIEKIYNFFQNKQKKTTVIEKILEKKAEKEIFVYEHSLETEIRLRKLNKGVWEISGKLMRQLIKKYNINEPKDLEKFNLHLKMHKIVECLAKQGLKKGDIVYIYDHQFEWRY